MPVAFELLVLNPAMRDEPAIPVSFVSDEADLDTGAPELIRIVREAAEDMKVLASTGDLAEVLEGAVSDLRIVGVRFGDFEADWIVSGFYPEGDAWRFSRPGATPGIAEFQARLAVVSNQVGGPDGFFATLAAMSEVEVSGVEPQPAEFYEMQDELVALLSPPSHYAPAPSF